MKTYRNRDFFTKTDSFNIFSRDSFFKKNKKIIMNFSRINYKNIFSKNNP